MAQFKKFRDYFQRDFSYFYQSPIQFRDGGISILITFEYPPYFESYFNRGLFLLKKLNKIQFHGLNTHFIFQNNITIWFIVEARMVERHG